jgi:hypothetical protein
MNRRPSIDFPRVASAALAFSLSIVQRWLPGGRLDGREWVSRNPKRSDHRPGSFKVNTATGRWSDFATGAAGGDLISLGAYLHDLDQAEAARRLAEMIGVDPHG